jgi:hypothetical protein
MNRIKLFLLITLVSTTVFYACKDKTTDPGPSNTDKCANKSITLTSTTTSAEKCKSNGKIVARAKGSTGFTFQLNSGTFQTDSTFNNLAAGTYTVTVKDVDGCTKTEAFIVAETGTKGPLYTFVASIIGAKCNNTFCHATGQDGAPKTALNTDCNIVARKELIKTKTVDGTMGNLDAGEKQKILDWYLAGGDFTD